MSSHKIKLKASIIIFSILILGGIVTNYNKYIESFKLSIDDLKDSKIVIVENRKEVLELKKIKIASNWFDKGDIWTSISTLVLNAEYVQNEGDIEWIYRITFNYYSNVQNSNIKKVELLIGENEIVRDGRIYRIGNTKTMNLFLENLEEFYLDESRGLTIYFDN